jgi:crotonobetainyl-CoA:carnitine CoA-transferase CaiB-like acyl-CoA transferase
MGQEHLTTDERFCTANTRKTNEDELERIVTAWTTTQNKWEVTHRLQAVGVAAYPTMSSKDQLEDPQLNERDFFVRLPHPEVGVRTHAGMPWLLAHAPNGVRAPAPLLGQDTEWVLCDLLGYSAAEIAQLKSAQALY